MGFSIIGELLAFSYPGSSESYEAIIAEWRTPDRQPSVLRFLVHKRKNKPISHFGLIPAYSRESVGGR